MKYVSEKKKIIIYETAAFISVIALLWVDEFLDLPHVIFGAASTPVNIAEGLIESFVVIIVALVTTIITLRLLKRIRYLKGFHRICSSCKKVYDYKKDEWIGLETFYDDNTDIKFTHGLCEECLKKFEEQI